MIEIGKKETETPQQDNQTQTQTVEGPEKSRRWDRDELLDCAETCNGESLSDFFERCGLDKNRQNLLERLKNNTLANLEEEGEKQEINASQNL
jgi:hypothetical protein